MREERHVRDIFRCVCYITYQKTLGYSLGLQWCLIPRCRFCLVWPAAHTGVHAAQIILNYATPLQLVWADTQAVGCGAYRCNEIEAAKDDGEDAMFLVCNYGPG